MRHLWALLGVLVVSLLTQGAWAQELLQTESFSRSLSRLSSAKQKVEKAAQEKKVLEMQKQILEEARESIHGVKEEEEPLDSFVSQLEKRWKEANGVGRLFEPAPKDRAQAGTKIEERREEFDNKIALAEENLEQAERKFREKSESLGALSSLIDELSTPRTTLASRLIGTTSFRCKMALCWGGSSGRKFAFEPLLDLPVSLTWSMGDGALPGYINSHLVNLEFNAGLRFWFAHDAASIAVYVSEPIIKSSDPIRVDGSSFSHTAGAIHRSYPSLGFGFFGDSLLLGLSYDVLRNGAADENQDPNFPPNEVLSRSLTFSIGFSFLNMTRNQIGRKDD